MNQRRVVVTGMGVVSPVGVGLKDFEKGIFMGKNGIKKITRFNPSSFRSQIAGEISSLKVGEYLSSKNIRRMDRFTQFGMIGAGEAVETAGLNISGEDLDKIGVLVGSGVGGLETIAREQNNLMQKGPQKVSPFVVPMLITDMASAHIAIKYGFTGPNFSISTACATGNHALGEAFAIIQRGGAEVMIAGGTEAAVTQLGLAGFCSMRALSTRNDEPHRASRPFDRERDGFVIGEGAGILVLEELERAKKRKAKIWAEIVGFGMGCDAYHITQPAEDGRGIRATMEKSLKDANINLDEVDYINAHGTSTPLNDKVETRAVKALFEKRAYDIPISSTKSMTGHLLGATGGVEAIACILAIQNQVVPPTVNYEFFDPECDLDYIPNQAREVKVDVTVSNSMGFGGHNATLVIKKFE